MFKLRHALSGAEYVADGDGIVRVEKDGNWGRFTGEGKWVEGEVLTADPEMCRWVVSKAELEARQGGPAARDRAAAFQEVGFDRIVTSIGKGEKP